MVHDCLLRREEAAAAAAGDVVTLVEISAYHAMK